MMNFSEFAQKMGSVRDKEHHCFSKKKINAYVQIKSFERFIKNDNKTAIRKLCEIFSDELPKIDENNAGRMLAELLGSRKCKKTEKEITH